MRCNLDITTGSDMRFILADNTLIIPLIPLKICFDSNIFGIYIYIPNSSAIG